MSKKRTGLACFCIAVFMFMIPCLAVVISASETIIRYSVFSEYFGKICILSVAVSACMLTVGNIFLFMAEKQLSFKGIMVKWVNKVWRLNSDLILSLTESLQGKMSQKEVKVSDLSFERIEVKT